jgi:hypothetical protein
MAVTGSQNPRDDKISQKNAVDSRVDRSQITPQSARVCWWKVSRNPFEIRPDPVLIALAKRPDSASPELPNRRTSTTGRGLDEHAT